MERTEVEKFDSESSESIDWEKITEREIRCWEIPWIRSDVSQKQVRSIRKNEAVSLHARKAICKGENA